MRSGSRGGRGAEYRGYRSLLACVLVLLFLIAAFSYVPLASADTGQFTLDRLNSYKQKFDFQWADAETRNLLLTVTITPPSDPRDPGPSVNVDFYDPLGWINRDPLYSLHDMHWNGINQLLMNDFTPEVGVTYRLVFSTTLEQADGQYELVEVYSLAGYVYRGQTAQVVSGAAISLSPGGYSGVSGGNGYYSIDSVIGGTYSVTVSRAGYQTFVGTVTFVGDDVSYNIRLTPTGFYLSGHVLLSGTDAGIEDATVTLSPGGWSDVTDSAGYYFMSAVPPGTYTATVSALGYVTSTRTVNVNSDMQMDFGLGRSPSTVGQFSMGPFDDEQEFIFKWADATTRNLLLTVTINYDPPWPGEPGPYVNVYFYHPLGPFRGDPLYSLLDVRYDRNNRLLMSDFTPEVGDDYLLILKNSGRQTVNGQFELAEITTLTGVVFRGESYHIVAGATISLSPGTYSAITDSSGHFSIPEIVSGTYTATVSASDYYKSVSTVTLKGQSVRNDFRLNPSNFVLGTRVREVGTETPIGRATVALSPGVMYSVTDQDGFCRIERITPGSYALTVFALNYSVFETSVYISEDAQIDVRLTPAPPSKDHEYYLWSGQFLKFRYQWTDTRTCTLTIEVFVETDDDDDSDETTDHVDLVFIDSANLFKRLRGEPFDYILCAAMLPEGLSRWHVHDFAPSVSESYYLIIDNSGEYSTPVESVHGWYSMTESYTVSGYVCAYGSGGTAIPGATVTVSDGGSASTDASGHYVIDWVSPGPRVIVISAEGYEFISSPMNLASDTQINFTLRPIPPETHSIGGYVLVAGSSTSIQNATVTLSPGGSSAASDESGHYDISGLPDGSYTFSVSASGYLTSTGTVSIAGTNVYRDIYLISTASVTHSVSGTVRVEVAATPVAGATVSFSPGGYTAVTDALGQYYVDGVPDGSYTVTVSAPGYQTMSRTITVSGADAQDDFSLVLTTYSVIGYVYKEGTEMGISGATVTLPLLGRSDVTDGSGHYSIGGLLDGTYSVRVSASGYRAVSDNVSISGQDLSCDFELEELAAPPSFYTISGYVRHQDTDEPIKDATLKCGNFTCETNETGYYHLKVPGGTYVFCVSSKGHDSVNVTVEVSGDDVAMDIEMAAPDGSTAETSGIPLSTVGIVVFVVAAATVALMYALTVWRRRG